MKGFPRANYLQFRLKNLAQLWVVAKGANLREKEEPKEEQKEEQKEERSVKKEEQKRKDNLVDCYLQGLWYIKNKI